MSKLAGFLPGPLEHHLDHLAPFCSLMEWPLIVTEEEICTVARSFYPELTVYCWSPLEAPFHATEMFDILITTLPRISFDEIFFIAEATLKKRVKTIWLPHGNSDKGHLIPWMEALSGEERAFVYGPKMMDFLRLKKVSIPRVIPVGNFRYLYYQKHRAFYENLLDQKGLNKSFILYAPTWQDGENSGSFEAAGDAVIEALSSRPLVIKPHPNDQEQAGALQKKLRGAIYWLDHFPPIYPLLERTSHLIGDFSSIGYDFLLYGRPLFFLNFNRRPLDDRGRFLHHYGTVMTADTINTLRDKLDVSVAVSSAADLVSYTFGEPNTWSSLIEKVKQLDFV